MFTVLPVKHNHFASKLLEEGNTPVKAGLHYKPKKTVMMEATNTVLPSRSFLVFAVRFNTLDNQLLKPRRLLSCCHGFIKRTLMIFKETVNIQQPLPTSPLTLNGT